MIAAPTVELNLAESALADWVAAAACSFADCAAACNCALPGFAAAAASAR